MEFPFSKSAWYPIASESDLPFRHVYHAVLMGHEFAVWRADDDTVNVWENRCLHRGVRLSIGINTGLDLKCQYHGWRYENGTGACTYIPAHPANAPARTIRNRTYPVRRMYGLVWTGLEPDGEPPVLEGLASAEPLALRPLPVDASADQVCDALKELDGARCRGPLQVETADAVYLVQPVSANASVIRGLASQAIAAGERVAALRRFNDELNSIRSKVESGAEAVAEAPADIPPSLPVMTLPAAALGREPNARMRVARKWQVAGDITGFRLEPIGGQLPEFDAGAHIDVHLPNGLVRQYSLTNGPGEGDFYAIAVKREPESAGGSKALCDNVREGDVLATGGPHNHFRLNREAARTILIAGGVGITPLLAMAKSLKSSGKPFVLHSFARSLRHLAFREEIEAFGRSAEIHLGLDAAGTLTALGEILARQSAGTHVYVCGPGPMLEAALAIAEAAGWPDSAVHFEYFSNNRATDDSSSFEVALARSALTLKVPAGKSIADVLRENGVMVPTSCEQGACGTCMTTVLDGVPDHQDVYLSKAERASGACIMPCISRSKSPRLVLDL